MLRNATGREISTLLLATIVAAVPVWLAWRDVKISARVMLAIEATSVSVVTVVPVLVLWRHGLHGDPVQFHLRGATPGGFRQGLALALYSFVGFESATALGSEARDPLKAIPRAVILTAILSGIFFTICAYVEVLGLRMGGKDLATTDLPMHVLASVGGIPVLGFLIDLGALFALFAGILACLTAAARVLLLMAHNGLTHGSMRATHARNETPTGAIIATGLAAFLPVFFLAAKGTSGLDVYGWLGSLAVYGFVVSYGLVCFALPGYLRDHHGIENAATKTIPMDRVCSHGLRANRESLSGARRRVWQAALHLSCLFGGGSLVVCVPIACEDFRAGRVLSAARDLFHCVSFAVCLKALESRTAESLSSGDDTTSKGVL
jgi:amino acid transporter